MPAPPRRDLRPALSTADSSRAGARVGAGARLYAWVVVLVGLLAAPAAAQVAPDASWRTLDTPHFRVNFMAGLDSLAHRTAARAELCAAANSVDRLTERTERLTAAVRAELAR